MDCIMLELLKKCSKKSYKPHWSVQFIPSLFCQCKNMQRILETMILTWLFSYDNCNRVFQVDTDFQISLNWLVSTQPQGLLPLPVHIARNIDFPPPPSSSKAHLAYIMMGPLAVARCSLCQHYMMVNRTLSAVVYLPAYYDSSTPPPKKEKGQPKVPWNLYHNSEAKFLVQKLWKYR